MDDEKELTDGKLNEIHKQWKFDKYYEKHPDEFAEQFCGCKLLPYQKALLKMLSVKDNIRPILYPKHNGYEHLMFVYKIAEFILGDNNSMVFLCGSNIDKRYKEIVRFTNGTDIRVTLRRDKEMITLEKQHNDKDNKDV